MRRMDASRGVTHYLSKGHKVNTLSRWLAALALLSGPMVANALSYTYELNGIGALKGFITTDCNNCVLNPNDFTAWSMTKTGSTFGTVTSTSSVPGASVMEFGSVMVATPAAITFDFGRFSEMAFTGDPTSQGAFIDFEGGVQFHFIPPSGSVSTCFGSPFESECGDFESYDAVVLTIATIVSPDTLLAKLLKEVTGVGPGKSLANDIELIQAYYAANDVQAACAVLTGFVGEVKAQNGKKIGPTLDAQFISDANMLQVAIGCN